jgi:hypothetical protein
MLAVGTVIVVASLVWLGADTPCERQKANMAVVRVGNFCRTDPGCTMSMEAAQKYQAALAKRSGLYRECNRGKP